MANLIENNADMPNGNNRDTTQYVILPCEPKNFRGFIAGLLGQPQIARGHVDGIFNIGMNDVANLYHLVTQRISKQNDSSQIHIAISVHYSDGHSVTHNTIEAFQAYHQTSDSYPIAISISFSYLIKFVGREHPEKQEISILITADNDFRHDDRPDIWFQSGLFSYRITHTEITWATDISGLLKNHANTIIDKSSGLKKMLAHRADEILGYWFSLILLGALIWIATSVTELHRTGAISSVQDATQYAVTTACIFFSLLIFLNSIERYFNYHVTLRYPSFIVLTEKDKEYMVKAKKKQQRAWLLHVMAWFFGLASGVLSNHIYSTLTKTLAGGS